MTDPKVFNHVDHDMATAIASTEKVVIDLTRCCKTIRRSCGDLDITTSGTVATYRLDLPGTVFVENTKKGTAVISRINLVLKLDVLFTFGACSRVVTFTLQTLLRGC